MDTALPTRKSCHAILAFLRATALALLVSHNLYAEESAVIDDEHWRLNGLADGARMHGEKAPFWQLVGGNSEVPAGSDLEIPGQGGIIRSSVGAVTAQTLSRFRLPLPNEDYQLEHIQGDVRYHINFSIDKRFNVLTPQLALSTTGSVFDMETGALGTQIDVIDGAVVVGTMDGVSEFRLQAGQSARVSSMKPWQARTSQARRNRLRHRLFQARQRQLIR